MHVSRIYEDFVNAQKQNQNGSSFFYIIFGGYSVCQYIRKRKYCL